MVGRCAMFLQHILLAFISANVVQTSYGPFHMTRDVLVVQEGDLDETESNMGNLWPQEGRRSAFGVGSYA